MLNITKIPISKTSLNFTPTQQLKSSNNYGGFGSSQAQNQALTNAIQASQKKYPDQFIDKKTGKTYAYVSQVTSKKTQAQKPMKLQKLKTTPKIELQSFGTKFQKQQQGPIQPLDSMPTLSGSVKLDNTKSLQRQHVTAKPLLGGRGGQETYNEYSGNVPGQIADKLLDTVGKPIVEMGQGQKNIVEDYGNITNMDYEDKSLINRSIGQVFEGDFEGAGKTITSNIPQLAGELSVEIPLTVIPVGPALKIGKASAAILKTAIKRIVSHPTIIKSATPAEKKIIETAADKVLLNGKTPTKLELNTVNKIVKKYIITPSVNIPSKIRKIDAGIMKRSNDVFPAENKLFSEFSGFADMGSTRFVKRRIEAKIAKNDIILDRGTDVINIGGTKWTPAKRMIQVSFRETDGKQLKGGIMQDLNWKNNDVVKIGSNYYVSENKILKAQSKMKAKVASKQIDLDHINQQPWTKGNEIWSLSAKARFVASNIKDLIKKPNVGSDIKLFGQTKFVDVVRDGVTGKLKGKYAPDNSAPAAYVKMSGGEDIYLNKWGTGSPKEIEKIFVHESTHPAIKNAVATKNPFNLKNFAATSKFDTFAYNNPKFIQRMGKQIKSTSRIDEGYNVQRSRGFEQWIKTRPSKARISAIKKAANKEGNDRFDKWNAKNIRNTKIKTAGKSTVAGAIGVAVTGEVLLQAKAVRGKWDVTYGDKVRTFQTKKSADKYIRRLGFTPNQQSSTRPTERFGGNPPKQTLGDFAKSAYLGLMNPIPQAEAFPIGPIVKGVIKTVSKPMKNMGSNDPVLVKALNEYAYGGTGSKETIAKKYNININTFKNYWNKSNFPKKFGPGGYKGAQARAGAGTNVVKQRQSQIDALQAKADVLNPIKPNQKGLKKSKNRPKVVKKPSLKRQAQMDRKLAKAFAKDTSHTKNLSLGAAGVFGGFGQMRVSDGKFEY